MGVGAGLYMYSVVVEQFSFAMSSPDEFLVNARRLYCLLIHKFTYLLQCKCIKMPLGTDVGLGPVQIVLDGDPVPTSPPKRDTAPNCRPMSIVTKRSPISATAEHLSDNFGHFTCMAASNLTKITETPQRRRTMCVVARIDAFSVSV